MCTVTFYKDSAGHPVLTSNRDEKIHRYTFVPELYRLAHTNYIAPKDQKASGTWIALDDNGTFYCLLNGGFKKHVSKGKYRQSRGLLILDALQAEDFKTFQREYSLEDIEPFTLIVYQEDNLYELVWTGVKKHVKKIDKNKPHIWSSATLYTPEEAQTKRQWFDDLFKEGIPTRQQIIDLHKSEWNQKGFLLNRTDETKTVSISQLYKQGENLCFEYIDLLNQQTIKKELKQKELISS